MKKITKNGLTYFYERRKISDKTYQSPIINTDNEVTAQERINEWFDNIK